MAKTDNVEMSGIVTDMAKSIFTVQCDNGHVVHAHLSGKMRQNKIQVVVGDQVQLEVSPYDLTKGRIQHRVK